MMRWTVLSLALLASGQAPEVTTTSGRVSGSQQTFEGTHSTGDYISFQGIPYARPPVGPLRFQEPQEVEAWGGTKNCSGGPPAMCPQMDFFNIDPANPMKISGSEDCLFLNIFTQSLPSTDMHTEDPLRPVLFYIHGGGFTMGAGSGGFGMSNSGEDYFMESGVVLVTINYRLGPLGFLALPGTNIQGNMGMKDQLMAMRWVKQNIARFEGDPGRITISGLSAGGVSVHAHVLSPLGQGEGLFHRAIAQSGSLIMLDGTGTGRLLDDSRRFFETMCDFNTTTNDLPQDMSETCLFQSPVEDIINEAGKVMTVYSKPWEERIALEKNDPSYFGFLFWVVVDDYADTTFLPTHPITILHNQQQKMVPFMTGITKDEGALIAPSMWKDM